MPRPENPVGSSRDVCREASSRRHRCLTAPSVQLWSRICVQCSDGTARDLLEIHDLLQLRVLGLFVHASRHADERSRWQNHSRGMPRPPSPSPQMTTRIVRQLFSVSPGSIQSSE
ncbi:hypothetical protein GQ55_3G034300 [Panicum hallii var. hallii]|uniref:Uncharacterized protein n=1 Tax=Panicum hallii var. hallii TaxID=1504633 RepID=A0A2T7E5C7_9POAL|nr:hypothetical protein GQ55_3G034300 [Panicum hallii var. hallii]